MKIEEKELFEVLNGFKKEYQHITDAERYEEVKFFTKSGAPVDRLMAICSRGGKDYLVDHTEDILKEVFVADELCPNLGFVTPATFRIGDKWGMVNVYGDIILEAKYDSIKPDANDYVFLTLDGKEGFIAGGYLIEPKFDSVEIGADEYIEVTLNGVKGYIDENGEFTTDRDEAYYHYMMFLD